MDSRESGCPSSFTFPRRIVKMNDKAMSHARGRQHVIHRSIRRLTMIEIPVCLKRRRSLVTVKCCKAPPILFYLSSSSPCSSSRIYAISSRLALVTEPSSSEITSWITAFLISCSSTTRCSMLLSAMRRMISTLRC